MTLIKEIGDDADLLTRSDCWLEQQRQAIASEIDRSAQELQAILTAQKIKRKLQQKNLVAVQNITRTEDKATGITVQIMNLPDAIGHLSQPIDTLDQINAAAQFQNWNDDGYDLPTSKALRN